ncbi:MarR family transcriptional regulator [bacterium]|nr:MarR family transcriptional regulator [bacterium]
MESTMPGESARSERLHRDTILLALPPLLSLIGEIEDRLGEAFAFEEVSLDHDEYVILMHLRDPERQVRMKDLARVLMKSPAMVTHTVDRLEERRYLERVPSKQDRRALVVRPTEKGRAALQASHDHLMPFLRDFFGFLDDEELFAFYRVLCRLCYRGGELLDLDIRAHLQMTGCLSRAGG